MKILLRHITCSDAEDYCFKQYGVTLPKKLEKVQQEWLDKLEETIMEEKEVEAIMKAKEDAGIISSVPKPGDEIEVTEVVELDILGPATDDEKTKKVLQEKYGPPEVVKVPEIKPGSIYKGKVKLTKEEMKLRVIDWIENIKADQRKIDTGLKFKPAVSTDDEIDALYRFAFLPTNDFDRTDGAEAFKFLFDGMLYEYIEHYRSDGYHKHYGEAFDALTDGTNWMQESERPGVEYFVEQQ